MAAKRHQNRLINETSPYLLQHAHNPVDWYPWGEEAIKQAKKLDRPIFLSIGYSACHWCHVMERESFEDEETAKLMNQSFINIKVDREERQDIDHIYMSAIQVLTQRGGWPMSVFLTPDLKPFYGGTYFPPEDRYGMPSFKKILGGVAGAWKERRDSILETSAQLTAAIKDMGKAGGSQNKPSLNLLENSTQSLKANFDAEFGGVGTAPKFFHTLDFHVALRVWKSKGDSDCLHMVEKTLEAWSRGGIRDHLAGGFHRYSTDAEWRVPHFEKMLYDNALVTNLFLEGYQATGKKDYAVVAHQTLDFLIDDMQSKEGGFFSTLDADSEGVEGKYYVWSLEEIRKILSKDLAEAFEKSYSVSEHGNWEHTNILERKKDWETIAKELAVPLDVLEDTLSTARRKLLAERKKRIAPGRDEKILTNWNGLLLETLTRAYQILEDDRYLETAQKTANFFLDKMYDRNSKTLFHTIKDGKRKQEGFLDDYSNFILGLLSLYESDFNPTWIKEAIELTESMVEKFYETGEGIFYFTAKGSENLIVRPIEAHDGATPSASGTATTALARLYSFTENDKFRKIAETVLGKYSQTMERIPSASGQFLLALDLLENESLHFVIGRGKDDEEYLSFLSSIRKKYLPRKTVLEINKGFNSPHFLNRKSLDDKTTVYLCRGQTCLAPITSLGELNSALSQL